MPSLRRGLEATAIYIMIVALGMAITVRVYDAAYGTPMMISHFWMTELLLVLLVLFYVKRFFGWEGVGFGRMNWRSMLWFLPAYGALAMAFVGIFPVVISGDLTAAQWQLLGLITFTTFLIGFSEEVMFRGILLRGALARISVVPAMFVSAVAFSLLHSVNLLGGLSLVAVIYQLAFTFVVGFFLAPLALRIGNLWPLIIWHWLWDLALFSGAFLDVGHSPVLIGLLIQAMIALVMWRSDMRR